MNIFVLIMLFFAIIGFSDKTFSLGLGLAPAFDEGFNVVCTMLICTVGITSVGLSFIQNHTTEFFHITSILPFDSTVIIGAILAPDMGGYPICNQLASSSAIGFLNGVILTSILGQLICFQIPVFAGALDSKEHPIVWKGFVVGLIAIPVGYIFAGLLSGNSIFSFLRELIPIIVFCIIFVIGLFRFTDVTVKIFSLFAKIILIIVNFTFIYAMLGIFFPSIAYCDSTLISDAALAMVKSAIIVAGSVVFAQLVRRFFKKPIQKCAVLLGINEISMLCLILGSATSLAILPLFSQMDRKGKFLNCAYATSAAYFLGGQMGFLSSYISSFQLTIYIVVKLICGLVSIFLAMRFYTFLFPEKEISV